MACRHPPAHPDTSPKIPEGEVWLTEDQRHRLDLGVTAVAEHEVGDKIETAGRIAFDDARVTHVFSPVSGRITRIQAKLGDHVRRGQPLATIQSPDLGTATSDLRKAIADEQAAHIDYRRQRDLVDKGAASVRDLEQAGVTAQVATAELARARERVRLLMGEGAHSRVGQTYVLRAEIEGDVIAKSANPGVEVSGLYAGGAAMELFTIGNLDRVWMIADVFEMDLGRVYLDAAVTVRVVAFPAHPFYGRVDWISEILDSVTRTARIRVVLDNDARHQLRPEMFATAEITAYPVNALAVPRDAVVRIGDAVFVFVERGAAADGRVRYARVPIELDSSVGRTFHPVLHGLERGQRIVTRNVIQLVGML